MDLKKMAGDLASKVNVKDVINKAQTENIVGDLDGDGKKESAVEEIKGKATQVFGNMFKKK